MSTVNQLEPTRASVGGAKHWQTLKATRQLMSAFELLVKYSLVAFPLLLEVEIAITGLHMGDTSFRGLIMKQLKLWAIIWRMSNIYSYKWRTVDVLAAIECL